MKPNRQLRLVLDALKEAGFEPECEQRSKHVFIKINGQHEFTVSNNSRDPNFRNELALRSKIRRLKELRT